MSSELPNVIHLHFYRGRWRWQTLDGKFCGTENCVTFIPESKRAEAVQQFADNAIIELEKMTCDVVGHLDFDYGASAYCGRCGIQTRGTFCVCTHAPIRHGAEKCKDCYCTEYKEANEGIKTFEYRSNAYEVKKEISELTSL